MEFMKQFLLSKNVALKYIASLYGNYATSSQQNKKMNLG